MGVEYKGKSFNRGKNGIAMYKALFEMDLESDDAVRWIDIGVIGEFSLFYIQIEPKHKGGKISFLTILGIPIIRAKYK